MIYAVIDGRAQLGGPPMLVTHFGAERGDRRGLNRRVIEPPVRAEERPTIGSVERRTDQRPTEIGRHPLVVGDLVADAVASRDAPSEVVLAPGEEIAGKRTAIA